MDVQDTHFWQKLREQKILFRHRQVANICEALISEYRSNPQVYGLRPKKELGQEKIIWQYWGQGYNQVPPVVKQCLDSIEQFSANRKIIRLSDANVNDYIDFPDFIVKRRPAISMAHFSDLLRLMLLKVYGGIWLDATVLLTAPIPEQYLESELFYFQRDPNEPNAKYWRNTYAYYFGWEKGFHVNMLNSILIAQKDNKTISDICNLMLLWWRDHDYLPDYFFLQILFDVYGHQEVHPMANDCLPHYLQQSMNDPTFNLMSRDDILKSIPIHKLTHKIPNGEKL